MSGEPGEPPDDNSRHRHIKKRVRVRVDEPHAKPFRKRVKKFWKKNRRWLVAAAILAIGIAVIWLSLRLLVGDALPRPPA